jgi:hypothetical protein
MPQAEMGVVRWIANPSIIVARILPADDAELSNPAWTKFVISGNPPLELVRVARPASTPLPNQTRIFLYGMFDPVSLGPKLNNGFPDPGNWNPLNRIEALGAGQNGWPGNGIEVQASGGGGGGGAYAVGLNVPVLSWPVPYTVWPTVGAPFARLMCIWGSTQYSSPPPGTPGMVFAEIGYGGQYSSPGVGGSVVYPNGYPGGNGGNGFGSASANVSGGGGGGAAGPAGAGGNGGAASGTMFGGGGNANGNTTAGGFPAAHSGVSGTEWGSVAGCGSGGAGSLGWLTPGGNGALYGGGGAGGTLPPEGGGNGLGGHGGDGLIVITYTPLPPGMQAQIMS